jgi:hypothetical protein
MRCLPKLHLHRLAFGERQNAERLHGIRVEKEDLLLAGNGNERSAWAGRQSGNGAQAGSVDDGSNWTALWHRRRPLRFIPDGCFQSQVHGGLLRGDSFAAGSFEQAALDPLFEKIALIFG